MALSPAVPPAAVEIQAQLSALLEHARSLKPSTDIEPPLQTSSLEPQIQALSAAVPHGDAQLTFEVAARTLLYTLVSQDPITSPASVSVWNLLDIIHAAANLGVAHGSCSLRLIEELFDTQTLAGCRRLFEYLESRREKLLKSGDGFTSEKSQIVLRMMNELLRRLSRSEDAVLSGRVYVFLFQSFPLGDKSSVNLRGEFHTENVTSFDEDVGKDVDEKMEDVGAEGNKEDTIRDKKEDKAKEEDIDPMKLYPIFWSLQQAFANPPSLFSEAALSNFKAALELTIKKFKSTVQPTTRTAVQDSTSDDALRSPSRKRKRGEPVLVSPTATTTSMAQPHNTKYLTAPSLFPLELADLAFHRHIALQSLITLDFLLSLTPRAKSRLTTLEPRTKQQKPLAFPSFTLSADDEKWCTSMRRSIEQYVKSSRDGVYYYRMVDNVLRRDVNWARWKAVSCPSIELAPLPTAAVMEARKGAKERVAWKRLRDKAMGTLDLDFLTTTLEAQDDELLPGVKRKSRLAENKPSAEALINEVATLDMDIDFLRPREGESFPERLAALETKEREADGKSRGAIREEINVLKVERQAYWKEKAALESRRATGTWRLLRGLARTEFGLLKDVREAGDVSICSEARIAEWKEGRKRVQIGTGGREKSAGAEVEAEVEVANGTGTPVVGGGEGDEDGDADVEMGGADKGDAQATDQNDGEANDAGDEDAQAQARANSTEAQAGDAGEAATPAEAMDIAPESQQVKAQPQTIETNEDRPQAIQVVDMQDRED